MTKRKTGMRLGVILVMCTLISFVLAVGAFLALDAASGYLIDHVIYTKEQILQTEKELFDEFIAYMNQQRATLSSKSTIQSWITGRDDLMLAVYDAQISYIQTNSDGVLYSSVRDALTMYDLLQDEYSDYWYERAVKSEGDRMRSRVVKVMYFPMYRAKEVSVYADLALAFGLFVAVLYFCIRSKTRYIVLLSRELQVMQGGDLSVPMTIKGKDELTSLAMDIEEMRKSFIERLNNEEMMTRNSQKLLTAMSHDLRTPLTSLIGYLDIVDLGKCTDPEQAQRYIHSGKMKAYQIKEMTDKLFEYFLVYSSDDKQLETEPLDASMLFSQLWAESAMTLEADGFLITVQETEGSLEINANPQFMRRVFDNIVSNIKKYADKTEPVIVIMERRGDRYEFEVRNSVRENNDHAESSGIGLASCKKIMENHGGTFHTMLKDNVFAARLSLPGTEAENT